MNKAGSKTTFEDFDFLVPGGRKVTVEVNLIADARSFVGMAGFPWIVIAANPQLSNEKIVRYLKSCGIDGAQRPSSWIQRKRFLFRKGEGNPKGAKANADGNYVRAIRIMREHPNASSRQMVHRLKERGIKRSRQWILEHRCDVLPTQRTI
jgi:hypothetical protein